MFASRLDDSYDADVRHAIGALTAARLGANSAVRFAAPFLATIASGLDVSITTVGAAIAVGEIVGLTAPLISRVTTRVRRRSAMTVGLLGIAAGATISATAAGAAQLAVGLAVMTVSKIMLDLGVMGWISERVPYERRGRVVGLTEVAWAGGLIIGVALMGLLSGITSWRLGYVLAIVAIVVLTVILRRRLPNEMRPVRIVAHERAATSGLGKGWLVIAGTLALAASAQAVFVTFGAWLEDDFDFSDTGVAIVVFGLGGAELIATASIMRFSDGWGTQRSTMLATFVIVPAGLLLALASAVLPLGLVALAVYVCAFEFAIVATLSLASTLVPARSSIGLGLMVGATTLGRAVMSPTATAVYSHNGMGLTALMGASCAAVAATFHWLHRGAVHAERCASPNDFGRDVSRRNRS